MLEYIGYICAFLAIASSLIGVTYVWELRSHVKKWSRKKPEYYPALTVIAPHRGEIDPVNIDAVLGQNYPGKWEVIFVTTQDDASLPQLQKYSAEHKNVKTVIADDVVQLAKKKGIHRCQKNSNVIAAIGASSPDTEIYVFVDADTHPFSDWLSNLIAPLTDSNSRLGAVTSARVYLPDRGLASWVQVLWILISDSFLVGEHKYIWGGGMAIPKKVFEEANLMSQINGQDGCSITTDDMNLYAELRKQGYETLFVPDCIVLRPPQKTKENLLDVIRFTNRQILQTWWTTKAIWIFLANIGIRFPMLLCALIIARWYPLCLLALLSILIDTFMGILALKTLIDAEPRVSAKMIFWEINSNSNLSDRLLEPKIRVNVNFWVFLLPIVTPFVVTINSIVVPFFRKMRWSGVEYTRRSVVGYTDDFSWRAK
ncbi:MAG: glycosyltransferase family 2 protein [Syntrophaceae bacterium]|nr:glycosyltransferase family 2 protein [Syntrophaceae bacterium]